MVERTSGAWVRGAASLLVAGAVAAAVGCGGSSEQGDDDAAGAPSDAGKGGSGTGGGTGARGGAGGSAAGGSGGTGGGTDPTKTLVQLRTAAIDKLDMLLMIDNSIGMADKQALLAEALPVLVQRLIQPACVDSDGNVVASDGTCAAGTAPEFNAVRNLHVGVITSSLGDHGSGDVCSPAQNQANVAQGLAPSQYDDRAELLPSTRTALVSWNNSGFLVWDPRVQSEVLEPHPNLTKNETNPSAFVTNLADQVVSAGQHGCGYEASLEAWYRFLVDPEPVASMSNNSATSVSVRGPVDNVVLAQRSAFLRQDSAVVIVMLSDENDCSVTDEDDTQGFLVGYKGGVNAGALWHMPRASAACATNPNDPCCRPCIAAPPVGCPPNDSDSSCAEGATLTSNEDAMNLRCYRQEERFGISLLYPTERYTEALTNRLVRPRFGGAQVLNPLFQGPDGVPAPREPGMVILSGIVGVPWQDLATEEAWSGDGLEYLDASELETEGRWDVILGDPGTHVLPSDTLMVESIDPRSSAPYPQQHPLVNAKVGAPEATALTNPINGHEHAVLPSRDDLQYACIFELPTPVVCTEDNADACDCNQDELATNSPLCEGGTATTDGTQRFAKAYPSLRQLEVLKSAGENAVVASICPKNAKPGAGVTKQEDPNYGYNPAVRALVKKVGTLLRARCLPRPLPVDGLEPRAACTVLEARPTGGACDCTLPAHADVSDAEARALRTELKNQGGCVGSACDDLCVCEIAQLDGAALERCQAGLTDTGSDYGFCYIDPAQGLGSEAAVASCEGSSKRLLRFVGDGVPLKDSFTFLDCTAN